MVSAACPNCNILLVEATEDPNSPYGIVFDDALQAIKTAVQLGATAISNSYGFPESAALIADGEPVLNAPGVSIFASSGDGSFASGLIYPASSQYVIAVGGTNLAKSPGTGRGWTETTWSNAGSGCSAYVNKPAWQTDSACPQRMVADVSAVADPATGVAVYMPMYDMSGDYLGGGWGVVGGTSVSSPLLAGIFAASGLAGNNASYVYANGNDFNDVTAGANGICTSLYECTAEVGYDGPTGVGTPNASLF
jgi:subtilase family serine protease